VVGDWLTDAEVGHLLRCAPKHARRIAAENGWRTREEACRGGRKKLFHRTDVESYRASRGSTPLGSGDPTGSCAPACTRPAEGSVPPAHLTLLNASVTGVVETPTPAQSDLYATVPAKTRAIVEYRMAALRSWEEWRARKRGTDQEFVASRQAMHPGQPISVPSLYLWKRSLKADGVDGLADGRAARELRGQEIPDQLERYFDGLYLDQAQPSISYCHRVTTAKARELELECPSIRTFERHVKSLPLPTLILARQGEKAWRDKCGPYIERDYSKLAVNRIWNSDHHQFDLICIGPDGKPMRPWVTIWEDIKSQRCLGVAVVASPNSDSIVLAFKRAAMRYGLPHEILIDNGKDYRSYDLAGGRFSSVRFEIEPGRAHCMMGRLGIEITFANPYNARSKPAERMFREWKEWFSRSHESYTGGNPREKPERLAAVVKRRDGLPTFLDIEERLGEYVEFVYNRQPCSREGAPRFQVFDEGLVTTAQRWASEESLALMCMRSSRPFKIGRNGVHLFDHWFDAPELYGLFGREVYVRYDPMLIGRVYVYDLEDRFLCTAECNELMDWGATSEHYRKAMAKRREAKAQARAYIDRVRAEDREPDALKRVIDEGKAAAGAEVGRDPPRPRIVRPVEMEQAMKRAAARGREAVATASASEREQLCARGFEALTRAGEKRGVAPAG